MTEQKPALRVAMAQLNLLVGDVVGNVDQILAAAERARDELHADVVLFPELALTGYPPEDLLNHSGLRLQVATGMERLREGVRGIEALVGFPEYDGNLIYNSAALVGNGEVRAIARKQRLPNYSVFDEKRYFAEGDQPVVVDIAGVPVGLCVCEDIWQSGPADQAAAAGAKILLNINASPFEFDKQGIREAVLRARIAEAGIPIVYVNLVGGQDELVFDGGSFVMAADGQVAVRAPGLEAGIYPADFEFDGETARPVKGDVHVWQSVEEGIYNAIVLGVSDYVRKNHFPGAVIGLSGGIDSALTMAIAADALGADKVMAVLMPSRFTAEISNTEAKRQAEMLGAEYHVVPIEGAVESFDAALKDLFAGRPRDTTEENIQARCRGVILMAISNKTDKLLLTTGNKSESAVGYATLYGDMAGGFAPICDLTKTMVYRLARYRNELGPAIPEKVITREPSAELAADQKDSDSLPPYSELDPILQAYVEGDLSVAEIVELGHDHDIVSRVVAMVQRNEYKRRQGPPGVRISRRAFGRDRRYPITSGYNPLAD
ncbi:MAG TPA: NAD+ synthase [Gammaproteobacteria bacterium]|nr:NAD+ synthase [Gammaproteobacteria bacterium]